ncbi:MAG: HoxN/HupN/NixA family nickel/cobalt transporter, partial [Chloroflexi bacterium]|nr:HoxN/HupN/NixA family nickel/cobalt transporter [Chloroflexota bacterium]
MPDGVGIALLVSGVGLGLRHGIDWDHIAAITDVTGAQPSRARALVMASLYALG